jgi:hypothetical protein
MIGFRRSPVTTDIVFKIVNIGAVEIIGQTGVYSVFIVHGLVVIPVKVADLCFFFRSNICFFRVGFFDLLYSPGVARHTHLSGGFFIVWIVYWNNVVEGADWFLEAYLRNCSPGKSVHRKFVYVPKDVLNELFVEMSYERRQRLKDRTGSCAAGISLLWRMIAHNVIFLFVSCVVKAIWCGAAIYNAGIRTNVVSYVFPVRMSNAKRILRVRILTPIDLGPLLPLTEGLGNN